MQTPQTQRLAKRIRRLRDRRIGGRKTPWRVICEKTNVLKSNGKPDTGLAFQIAYEGKEPADREVRKRLGLRDLCVKCHRPFRKKIDRPAMVLSPAREWWIKLSKAEQDKIIEKAYEESE